MYFHRREQEARVVGQLLTLMDGNKKTSKMLPHIAVVASTNRYGHATLVICYFRNIGIIQGPCLRILLGQSFGIVHFMLKQMHRKCA
jgi:hypothetical protein